MTDPGPSWQVFGPCPRCNARAGAPCLNLRTARRDRAWNLIGEVTHNPHPGRKQGRTAGTAPPLMDVPYVLRLPFRAPPMLSNAIAGKSAHWSDQSEQKKIVQAAVVAVVRQARVPQLFRVAVTVTWHAPDYGTRDPDGLFMFAKAALDGLTPPRPAVVKGTMTQAGTPRKKSQAAKLGAGIIPDDNAQYVASVTTAIVLGSDDPRVELRLDPLPALPVRTTTTRGAAVRTSRRR